MYGVCAAGNVHCKNRIFKKRMRIFYLHPCLPSVALAKGGAQKPSFFLSNSLISNSLITAFILSAIEWVEWVKREGSGLAQ